MRNEKGIGLLMTTMGIIAVLVTFLQLTTYISENMFIQLGRTKKQLAGYLAMQDFAVLAQKAYQVFTTNGGICPAGTRQVPAGQPFCWPDTSGSLSNNIHCIPHPIPAPPGSPVRLICLDATTPESMNVVKNDSMPWWKKFISSFSFTAEAQAGREPHLPALTGAPLVNYAAAPNCTSSYNATYCKRCETIGTETQNLNCAYLRVCLSTTPCNPANNNAWTIQRIGVQRYLN